MNFDQPKEINNKEVIKTPENIIKDGIDFVFSQTPEIASIGNKEQYSRYIDTVFPDTKIKDILYHGTGERFKDDKFDLGKKENKNSYEAYGSGIYFERDLERAQGWSKGSGFVYPVLLNTKRPDKYGIGHIFSLFLNKMSNQKKSELKYKLSKYGFFDSNIVKEGWIDWVIVFSPDQIHILGSSQDIEQFKNFVKEK